MEHGASHDLLPAHHVFVLHCGRHFMARYSQEALTATSLAYPMQMIMIFGLPTMITGYYASGLQNGTVNMTGAFLPQFVLLPCAWLLSRAFGARGVWFAFWISEVCAFIFAAVWKRRRRK